MYKKLLAAVILVILAGNIFTVSAYDGVSVIIDGESVVFGDQPPVIDNGRTLVPLRGVFEHVGFTVEWDAETSTAALSNTSHTIQITVGETEFYTNNIRRTLEVPAQIIGGRVLLPIREVLTSVGYEVEWLHIWNTITVASPYYVRTLAGTGTHGHTDGTATQAQFNLPAGIFSDGTGLIHILDTYNNLIREISPNGSVRTVSGQIQADDEYGFPLGRYHGGSWAAALYNRPTSAVMIGQNVYIADSANHVIRVNTGDSVLTFASETDEDDDETAMLYHPTALVVSNCQTAIYFADTLNHVIRRVDLEGNATTVAGVAGSYGFNDGAADTALFSSPMGLAINEDGTIFVADTGNHLIRMIDNGNVYTFAGTYQTSPIFDNEPIGGFADGASAMFNLPIGLAFWNNTLIVADSANHRIRAISPTGFTTTLAGTGYPDANDGAPRAAAFQLPRDVYVRGNMLYIADTGNNMIRVMVLR